MTTSDPAVIGIDIGRYFLKSVRLECAPDGQVSMTHYGFLPVEDGAARNGGLAPALMQLLGKMGCKAKLGAVSVSDAGDFIRIVEQPQIPEETLRENLRRKGAALFHRDVAEYTIDCKLVGLESLPVKGRDAEWGKYLVTGIPRSEITRIGDSLKHSGIAMSAIQPAALCGVNAFQYACAETFEFGTFVLVDVGPEATTVVAGCRGVLLLTRTIDFGSRPLLETLSHLRGSSPLEAMQALDYKDEGVLELTAAALQSFARDLDSSIVSVEEKYSCLVERVHVSGGLAQSAVFRSLLGEVLGLPCIGWNTADRLALKMPVAKREELLRDSLDLNTACGAALELLREGAKLRYRPNLLHEVEHRAIARRRDPLRWAAVGIGVLLVVCGLHYAAGWRDLLELRRREAGLAAEVERSSGEAALASAREKALIPVVEESSTLAGRVEGRFYWAPLLAEITSAVPDEIQLLDLAGYLTREKSKSVRLTMTGISSGEQPRDVAECFRASLQRRLAAQYENVSVKFTSLADSESSAAQSGMPEAEFSISAHFEVSTGK